MSPYDLIRRAYRDHPQERSFEWYWDWHCEHGFAYATPDFAVMGRNCYRESIEAFLRQPQYFDREEGDTWYIHALAGDMSKCWSILPWPLEWIAFERIQGGKRDLRFYRTETLRRLSSHESKPVLAAMAEV